MSIIEAAHPTFLCVTFWTERIGPAAALKTLEVMGNERSWERITATGREITRRWQDLAKQHGLRMKTTGLPALTSFSFTNSKQQAYKTLITQEMLKKGLLAATSVYVCLAHTQAVIDRYFGVLTKVFAQISRYESGLDSHTPIHGTLAQTGFKRLN